ncbi:TetR/AcrR family transcriptional regulator [Undibacterium arcticum]|uniref:TetR/AcrR family transcriptional regulator n=1 Tax=Undibacterium arcticum TaxID=1762892 RepID=A0ABV7EVE7_9BURK
MITFPSGSSKEASTPDLYREALIANEAVAPPREPAVQGQRRSQVDRSREARDRLLAAAIDVLIRKGYNGLTTKEVASGAHMSNGALMHHFVSKEELVVAATASVYQAAISRGQQVANTAEAATRPIEGFITDCLSIYFDWPFIAALEVIMVARTDTALMERILPVMEEYRDTVNVIWLKVFEESGMAPEKARTVLNFTLNLVRGMAVNSLWRKNEKLYKEQLQEWVMLMHSTISHA